MVHLLHLAPYLLKLQRGKILIQDSNSRYRGDTITTIRRTMRWWYFLENFACRARIEEECNESPLCPCGPVIFSIGDRGRGERTGGGQCNVCPSKQNLFGVDERENLNATFGNKQFSMAKEIERESETDAPRPQLAYQRPFLGTCPAASSPHVQRQPFTITHLQPIIAYSKELNMLPDVKKSHRCSSRSHPACERPAKSPSVKNPAKKKFGDTMKEKSENLGAAIR